MTGPQDGEFPQVEPADPVSLRPPADAPGAVGDPGPVPAPAFDTGSDAWWRAQAETGRPDERSAADRGAHVLGPDPVTDELALPVSPAPGAAAAPPVPSPPAAPAVPAAPAAASPVAPTTGSPVTPVIPRLPAPPRRRPPAGAPAPVEASFTAEGSVPPRVRRRSEPPGPRRALAGAGLALAGVCLGIGTLLWLDQGTRGGGPAVALPPAGSTTSSSSEPTSGSVPPGTPDPTVAAPTVPATSSAPVTTAATPAPVVVPPAAPAPAARSAVTVLNNSRYAGLAERAATRFRAGGWATPVVGNFTGRVAATTVYYAPGQLASAQRFARQFGIARVLPRFAGLPGSGLTVVLTRDFA